MTYMDSILPQTWFLMECIASLLTYLENIYKILYAFMVVLMKRKKHRRCFRGSGKSSFKVHGETVAYCTNFSAQLFQSRGILDQWCLHYALDHIKPNFDSDFVKAGLVLVLIAGLYFSYKRVL
jgi:hypothetical protein